MLNNDLTKYLTMNPQAFSYTMLGLSTLILAYFVGEDNTEPAEESTANIAEETEEVDNLNTDESTIEELLNKPFSSTEQRGGKKLKSAKLNDANNLDYNVFAIISLCSCVSSVGNTTSNSTTRFPVDVIPKPLITFRAPLKIIVLLLFITNVLPLRCTN